MTARTKRCVRELWLATRLVAVAWSPDGRLAIGDEDGGVEVLTPEGRRRWRRGDQSPVNHVLWSPDGRLVASASVDHTVRIRDGASGHPTVTCRAGQNPLSVAWSPDGRRLACDASECAARIFDAATGELLRTCSGHRGAVVCVVWSPDGARLASASHDTTIRIWDAASGAELGCWPGHEGIVWWLAWSPDGRRLASGSSDRTVRVWDATTGECLERGDGHRAAIKSLAWSPDGKLLASSSDDQTVRIWSPETGRELAVFADHAHAVRSVAFSPDGALLASASWDGTLRLWDPSGLAAADSSREDPALSAWAARQAATVGRERGTGEPGPGSRAGVDSLVRLHRLGLAAPLCLHRDLLRLTGGLSIPASWSPLGQHPGIRRLTDLGWPTAARVGLVGLLLRDLPVDPVWKPPAGTAAPALREALVAALARAPEAPARVAVSILALIRVADRVDDRLLTLLAVLGPEAVAADPGLPLRLLPRVPHLPPLAAAARRRLGQGLELTTRGGAHGPDAGSERTGIDRRGDLRSLVPTQLALPAAVLTSRHRRGGLLYRIHSGHQRPRLPPAVLVLDVSPPTFGPIEALTRLSAHLIARALRQAGRPVVLVTAGGAGGIHVLRGPADLVAIWTLRSQEPADERRALRVAGALGETLAREAEEPIIVLLSHVHFGADRRPASVPGLRGLFVQFPGRQVRPPLADLCERWASVGAAELGVLHHRLGHLLTPPSDGPRWLRAG